MHLPVTLLLLLASLASTLPNPQGAHYSQSGLPPQDKKPKLKPCEDLSTDPASASKAKQVWETARVQFWLDDFLGDGLENWSHRLFEKKIKKKYRSNYNCALFPGGNCGPPGSCAHYDPPEAYFVHASLANFESGMDHLHEAIQDDAITALAGDINDIVDVFGPPSGADSYIWTLLIGIFVLAAGAAGPMWKVGAPMTGMVGVLNVGAGAFAATEPDMTLSFTKDLENQLRKFYKHYRETIEDTVIAVATGKFKDAAKKQDNEKIDDPKKWISGMFKDGKMLSSTEVTASAKDTADRVGRLLRQGFVVRSLYKQGYKVVQRWDISEHDCKDDSKLVKKPKYHTSIWVNGRCTLIGKPRALPGGTRVIADPLSDDQMDVFTGSTSNGAVIKLDYKEAIQNALDCDKKGGGDPKFLAPKFTGNSQLPDCFVNLPVKVQDIHGDPPK